MSNVTMTDQPLRDTILPHGDLTGLTPVAAVICYPFLLDAFHRAIGPAGSHPSVGAIALAVVALIAAFAVSALGIAVANRPVARPSMRRLAYASVAAPTLYVFLGVVNYMAKSAYPDTVIWSALWIIAALWAWFARSTPPASTEPDVARGRIGHGIVAALISIYVLFHLANHLFLLVGTDAHTAVRQLGEVVYRAPSIELILVLLMLFMCASGLYLAWNWSASDARHDFFRTFQIASGIYLLMYITGHMDSVFIYARLYLRIPTDWAFAAGAPAGMIHDPWNIRLLPHYALGAFFVLAHPATGLRRILLTHGVGVKAANRVWVIGIVGSAVIATAIIIGLCRVIPT